MVHGLMFRCVGKSVASTWLGRIVPSSHEREPGDSIELLKMVLPQTLTFGLRVVAVGDHILA
jgi:hypothetical protein